MDSTTVQFLLDRYKPVFYLFSKEKYKPSSMEYLLLNANLVENAVIAKDADGKDLIKDGVITVSSPNVTNALLYDLSKGKYQGQTGLKTVYLDFPERVMYGESDVSRVPIYGLVRDKGSYIELIYILNFPYNGPFNVLNSQKTGVHWGDLEHITILLNKPTDGSLNDIQQVMFGAHGSADGRWVKKSDLTLTDDGKIVVFVADHSHALYHKPRMVFRLGGVANDYTDYGIKWEPPYVQALYFDNDPNFNKDTMGWIYFAGRIGYDGISSLVDKYWFSQGEPLPEQKPLSSPPIIDRKSATVYYFIVAAVIVAAAYGIVKLGFYQKRIDPDIYFAIVVALFIIGYDRLRYIIRVVS